MKLFLAVIFLMGLVNFPAFADTSREPFTCDLWTDPQGITHLRAPGEEAAYACFGYIHARDRAWEVDYFRKTVQGRKAEIYGSQEIRADFMMRLLGLYLRARGIFDALPTSQKKLLQAYSTGINQGFDAAIQEGVYEFEKWGYTPEPWKPEDTIALILLQSFDQTRESFVTDLEEDKDLQKYGKTATQLFLPDGLPWDATILKPGEFPLPATPKNSARGSETRTSMAALDFFEQLPELLPPVGAGSNNWVVAPGHSKTGHAWLANDPHLELRHPSMWHMIHIQSPTLDVIGAAVPGIPVIVSGANRHLAWGLTNSYLKVADLTLIPAEELKEAAQERPVIWFKFWKLKLPFAFKAFKRTRGDRPILPLEGPEGKELVLNWSGYDLNAADFTGLFELMGASSAKEADIALSRIGLPSWNFVFADKTGKIGYRAVGRIPRREEPREFGIAEQNLAAFEQRLKAEATLATEEMPHLFDPPRGWIATANNRQWPAEAKFYIGRSHRQSFRQSRIEELLTKDERHDFESFRRIQCDVQATDAKFILPHLLQRTPPAPEFAKALGLLKGWDYQADLDCEACAIYRRWIDRLRSESGLNLPALYRISRNPELFPARKNTDESGLHSFTNLLTRTLGQAITDLGADSGGNFPKWSEVHRCPFVHLGDRDFFTDLGIKTPGDAETVNPGSSKWRQGAFQQDSGASQRLIVELSDPPTVYSILPGQMKDRADRDFEGPDSPWRKWVNCDYEKRAFPLEWSKVGFTKISL